MSSTKQKQKQHQQLVYKTVRSDGTSCWATGVLERRYEIGETYSFTKQFPAFCFSPWYDDKAPKDDDNLHFNSFYDAYCCRREQFRGNRLLLCLAEGHTCEVPVFEFWEWPYRKYERVSLQFMLDTMANVNLRTTVECFAATKLTVIGEIIVPHYQVDREQQKPTIIVDPSRTVELPLFPEPVEI